MDDFKGEKIVKSHGPHYSANYVGWLEQQIVALQEQLATTRATNSSLRKQLLVLQTKQNKSRWDDYDHVPYPDDDRDR